MLWIEDLGRGRIKASFHTAWANGHSCEYEGEGTVDGDRSWMDADPLGEGDEAAACRPILTRKDGEVQVSDPVGACTRAYCGNRGTFDASFTFSFR